MADDPLKSVLTNVEQELAISPEVAKFAPAKLRGGTLETTQSDIRKAAAELLEHARKLDDQASALKTMANDILRNMG